MNKKIVMLGLTIGCVGGWYYYSSYQHKSVSFVTQKTVSDLALDMRDYEERRDHHFVHELFKNDWYILLSSPTYDVDYMLREHAPNSYEKQYVGKMPVKIMFVENKPVGLTSYYMRNEHLGHILFIIVDKNARGKGYSKQLVAYAEQELLKMGAKVIKIDTREENLIAQKLYTGFGYSEKSRDHGFVTFTKRF